MVEVENILFDFNGTIVNDVELCINLLNEMLMMRQHPPVTKAQYLKVFTFPIIKYYELAGFVFPRDNFDELAKYFIEVYTRESVNCKLYEDVVSTLTYFKNKNKTMSIVSASEENLLNYQLETYQIKDYFIGISGLDNINALSKIESAKRYIEKMGFDREKTIFVGDTLHDYEVACALGVKCILVSSGHQDREVLSASNCIVIDTLKELKEVIY